MIYGYKLKKINKFGLLEMKEITFAAPPNVLREIAHFLESMADQMEKEHFRTTHRHIGQFFLDWDTRFPNKDVIGSLPIDDQQNELSQ